MGKNEMVKIKKYRVYLRISKNGKVEASKKPKFKSFENYRHYFPHYVVAGRLNINNYKSEEVKL